MIGKQTFKAKQCKTWQSLIQFVPSPTLTSLRFVTVWKRSRTSQILLLFKWWKIGICKSIPLFPPFALSIVGNSDYSSYFCHYSLLDRNQLTCCSSTHAATARLRKPQWILQPTVDDTLCWSLTRKGDDSCGWKGGKYLPKEWGHIPWEKEHLQRCLGRGYRGYVSSQGIHWTQLLQLIFLHNSITARTTRNDNNIRGAMILNQK